MYNSLGNVIPTDFARRYLFDGNGNSTTGSNNATVTNGTWIKSDRMYQNQCLSWGASTTCAYASVTYTNSYIWIYTSGVWTFTKNSAKVTATALNGVNGERYAGLTFFNRTLTTDEEQLLQLEGRRLLGPTNIAKYPSLLSGLVWYWDFRGSAHNLVDGSLATVSGATLTTDRFGNSNSAYSFDGVNDYIYTPSSYTNNQDLTVSLWVNITTNPISQYKIIMQTNTQQALNTLYYVTISGAQYLKLADITDNVYTASHTVNLAGTGWRHIMVTKSGTTQQIYLDGVAVGTSGNSGTSTIQLFNARNTLGTNHTLSGQNFNGIIGEVVIYNKALSSDEIKALYTLTSQDYIYPAPSYDLPNLREGLVLDLNEQGKDLSGNGNNGTLVNSPTVVRQGKAKGLTYNGSNQYIDCGNILNITGDISIFTWIKQSGGTNYERILSKYYTNISNYAGYQIQISNNGVLQGEINNINSGSTSYYKNGTKNLKDGKWHLVGLTRISGQQMKLWVDGVEDIISVTNGTPPTSISTTTNTLNIGRLNFNGTWYYGNITVENPRIRNRALSSKEIQQLYYSQKANFVY